MPVLLSYDTARLMNFYALRRTRAGRGAEGGAAASALFLSVQICLITLNKHTVSTLLVQGN